MTTSSLVRSVTSLLAVAGAALLLAAFAPHLPDARYASRPIPPQEVKPAVRIGALVHPTVGFPALARAGETAELVLLPRDLGGAAPGHLAVVARLRRGFAPPLAGAPLEPGPADDEVLLEAPLPVLREDPAADGTWRVRVLVPPDLPALAYDLAVTGPPALVWPKGTDVQPLALRVLPVVDPWGGDGFVFALLADHQLLDPSRILLTEKNAGAYPAAADGAVDDGARAIALQIQHELALLDPAFTLYAGDLVFGLDYEREFADALRFWRHGASATFLAIGNHDAYASFTLDASGAFDALGGATGRCATRVPTSVDAVEIFDFVSCLYGDAKEALFRTLVEDGRVAWERSIGPPWYAFDHDGFRFVVLDTYDGSAARRHAIVVGLAWAGLDVGVPTTDNYGGWVGPEQLAWLEATCAEAAAAGLSLVLVGHHDPRGNLEGSEGAGAGAGAGAAVGAELAAADRYVANDPFPTSPFGLGPFEEWNYDGAWDSDPRDGRGPETPERNSATAVLAVLARHGGTWLMGHGHVDADARYEAGALVGPGVRAHKPVEFVRVTTAAAATRGDGYQGYRVLRARAGHVEGATFSEALGLASVPAGNFWMTARLRPGLALPAFVVEGRNALPAEVHVRLALPLPPFATGWDARLADGPGKGRALPLLDAADGTGGRKILSWALALPAAPAGASFPPPKGAERAVKVEVKPASGNHPPAPVVRVWRGSDEVGPGAFVAAGEPVTFDVGDGADPDGEPPWRAVWRFDDAVAAVGTVTIRTFAAPADVTATVTVTDPHGAAATVTRAVRIAAPLEVPPGPPPPVRGCHCAVAGRREAPFPLALAAAGIAAAAFVFRSRRRELGRRPMFDRSPHRP